MHRISIEIEPNVKRLKFDCGFSRSPKRFISTDAKGGVYRDKNLLDSPLVDKRKTDLQLANSFFDHHLLGE